jgi:hypothetical protein
MVKEEEFNESRDSLILKNLILGLKVQIDPPQILAIFSFILLEIMEIRPRLESL